MAKTPKTKPTFSEPPAGMEHHAADENELASIKDAIPKVEATNEQKLKLQYTEFSNVIRQLTTGDDLVDLRENAKYLCRIIDGTSSFSGRASEESRDFLREWFRIEENFASAKSKIYAQIDSNPELAADLKQKYNYRPMSSTKKVASLSGKVAGTKPLNFNVEDLDELKIEEIKLRSSLGGMLNVLEQLSQESQLAHADIAFRLQNDTDETEQTFEELSESLHGIGNSIAAAEDLNKAFRKVQRQCALMLEKASREFPKHSGQSDEV